MYPSVFQIYYIQCYIQAIFTLTLYCKYIFTIFQCLIFIPPIFELYSHSYILWPNIVYILTYIIIRREPIFLRRGRATRVCPSMDGLTTALSHSPTLDRALGNWVRVCGIYCCPKPRGGWAASSSSSCGRVGFLPEPLPEGKDPELGMNNIAKI